MREEKIDIRMANLADVPAIHGLVMELATYEKAPEEVEVNIEQYKEDFKAGWFQAFVAELGGTVIGTTIFYHTYSTWKGRMIYLEDFVISEKHRRRGFGKQLFDHFVTHCRSIDVNLIRWQVLDWNQSAIDFYNQYTVEYADDWLNVKMTLQSG